MAERLTFVLDGRDDLSRVLGHAGDSATRLRDTMTDASDGSNQAILTLTRDADGRLRDLQGQFVSTADAARLMATRTDGMRAPLADWSRVADQGRKAGEKLKAALISLAPAAIPAAAAMAPLVASTAAAGVAVGVYAVALGPQIAAMSEATESEKKYEDAVQKSGKGSKEAVAAHEGYRQAMAKLPPATRTAAAGLSVLKDEYKGWSDSLAKDTMGPFTKGLAIAGGLLPKLTPLVKGTSVELNRMMTILAGGMQSPGFDRLIKQFTEFATGTLAKVNSGLVKLSQSLDMGKVGGGLSEFMDYAKANGPMVADTLKNIGLALTRLLIAASDVGVGMLTVVNAFSKLVAAMPTGLITALMQAAIAFKAISLASAGMALVGARFASATPHVTGFVRAARFGGVASAISGVAQSMSLLQKSTVVLAVLAGAALAINELADKAKGAPPDVDKLTTSLKNLSSAGKFTGELKATFGDMDGFVAGVRKMRTETDALDKAKPFTSLIGMGPIAEKLTSKIDDLTRGTKSLSATKDDYKAFDETFASMATSGHVDLAASKFKMFESALRASGRSTKEITALFPEYKAAVASIKAEQELAARAMGLFGNQAQAVQQKLAAQKQSADGLRQSIQALNDVQRAGLGGMIGFEAAIDAASKAAKENAGALTMTRGQLNLNTEKSRTAASALNDLAAKTDAATGAARDNGASWSKVNGIYQRGRGELIKSAMQMGLTRAQAKRLADQILKTPDKTARLKGNMEDLQAKLAAAKKRLASVPDARKAKVRADIAQLQAAISKAKGVIASIHGKTVVITTHYRITKSGSVPAGTYHGSTAGRSATGGLIRGPGTSTSDSIPRWLSDGEYVIPAKRVSQLGVGFFDAIRTGRLGKAAQAGRSASPGIPAGRPATGRGGAASGPVVINIHVNGTVIDRLGTARAMQEAFLELKRTKGGALLGLA